MKILAAYKPSPLGEAVLEVAISEARLRHAQLVIVRNVRQDPSRVSGPLALMDPGVDRSSPASGGADSVTKLRQDLEALAWQVQAGGVACDAVLIAGSENHADAILDLARNAHMDMIVVGIRRRSRVGKAVLRSHAQRILLEADCAVLAVKSD